MKILVLILLIIAGVVAGLTLGDYFNSHLADSLPLSIKSHDKITDNKSNNKPLYWVAPMDANYRRDQPGKSPMGMDLVPVYADDNKQVDGSTGTIYVSPDVVNSLGVRTVETRQQTLPTQIDTVGYVVYDEDKLVHIHPRVKGWVEKLYVKAIGDRVKKGQALYDIYSPELVNAQEEFLLALTQNNARLISAAENRLTALQIPKSTVSALKKTKQVNQLITFYAPQNGVVKRLDIREGFYVEPITVMLSIADLSTVWVKAEIFERQAEQVALGNNVVMTLDYLPNRKWHGKVNQIYPMINTNTRTVSVRFSLDNQGSTLKPNMFAQVTIDTGHGKPALLIPKEALIRTGNQDRVVLALGQGKFKSVAVSVGRFGQHDVEILSGLSKGESVVSSAQFLLDSESSKSSDFKRMNHDDIQKMDHSAMKMSEDEHQHKMDMPTHVTGTIKSVMPDHRMVSIKVAKWQDKEAADVDFIVDDSVNDMDMALLIPEAKVMFTFTKKDSILVINHVMTAGGN